jgi:acetaldehyde dehydrogenase (acetylating)
MTLGSGGIGGSITGDNITTTHLLNVKRLAYEKSAPPASAMIEGGSAASNGGSGSTGPQGLTQTDIEEIVRRVLKEVGKG